MTKRSSRRIEAKQEPQANDEAGEQNRWRGNPNGTPSGHRPPRGVSRQILIGERDVVVADHHLVGALLAPFDGGGWIGISRVRGRIVEMGCAVQRRSAG